MKQFTSVSNTNKLFAGVIMAFLCTVVILGTNIPFVVEKTSNTLVALGVFGISEILTFCWAFRCRPDKQKRENKNLEEIGCFFMLI